MKLFNFEIKYIKPKKKLKELSETMKMAAANSFEIEFLTQSQRTIQSDIEALKIYQRDFNTLNIDFSKRIKKLETSSEQIVNCFDELNERLTRTERETEALTDAVGEKQEKIVKLETSVKQIVKILNKITK